jgi:Ca-activated chloride channel family protein
MTSILAYIEAPAGQSAIQLKSLAVHAVVSGLYAQTTQTLEFFNPNSRALEGWLHFPLPAGAVVCGYALEVQGQMVEGVVVPKQEARRILEAEVRKGVDPGLVEQVAGNLYRTRIYPLPAQGSRRIQVSYVQELTCQDHSAHFHLPLPQAQELAEIPVRLEVLQAPVGPNLQGLSLQAQPQGWLAEGRLPGHLPHNFHLELPDLPDQFGLVERTPEGEVFFCISCLAPPGGSLVPNRLGLAWDASGSHQEWADEIAFLRTLAEHWPTTSVDLLVFRESCEAMLHFPTLSSALDHLESAPVPRDGATDLSQLDFSQAGFPHCQACILVSDGMDSLGRGLPKLGTLPILTITDQVVCDSGRLGHLSRATQGLFLNLSRQLPTDALREILEGFPRQLGWHCEGGSQVHLTQLGGRFQVLGKLDANAPEARLQSLRVNHQLAHPGNLLARAWAGLEVEAMQAEGKESDLVELGRRYGLVTPGTSLLVLESLEQYLLYDLCPPLSQPEMRAAFLRQREQTQALESEARQGHLDIIAGLWHHRVQWWETDFEYSPEPAPLAKEVRCRQESFEEPACMALADNDFGEVCASDAAPDMECLRAYPAPACEAAPSTVGSPCPAAPEGGAPSTTQALPQEATIQIRPWDPETPYLKAMAVVDASRAYEVYLEHRCHYAASPSFFLDCADYLLLNGQLQAGLRVLSNLLELGLDDAALLRMCAWRLQQAEQLDPAIFILERVHRMRPDEPQSHRDLALALGDRNQPGDRFRALELLYHVVQRPWDNFPEIELVALMELNRLLAQAEAAGMSVPDIDPRLKKLLDLDVRISMAWDADLTDVDLHVYEPNGEHAYYGNSRTQIGGLVSRDFRNGYGPEEYVLRRAYQGEYRIESHYYGSSQQTLTGPCTVLVQVFTDYARPTEKRQMLTLRLDQPGVTVPVGNITIREGKLLPRT